MTNSNSYRLHFLRREGENSCNIANPIVAIEDGLGYFNPRRPEAGETYPNGKFFRSAFELNSFLIDREHDLIDHDKLFEDQAHLGIDPYYEFVGSAENSGSSLWPGSPSIGGWNRERAFHPCISDDVLDLRSKLLLAAEFRAACRNPITSLRSKCSYDTDADLTEAAAQVRHKRKHRWMHKRPDLPPGAPRFYREAQQWLHTRHREHGLMWQDPHTGRCELARECRCANAAESYQQAKRGWSKQFDRDRQSVCEEPIATQNRNVWDGEP